MKQKGLPLICAGSITERVRVKGHGLADAGRAPALSRQSALLPGFKLPDSVDHRLLYPFHAMDTSFDWIAVRNAVLWLAPTFALPVYCYYISHTRRNLLQHLLWMLGIAMTCMIPMTVTVENSSVRSKFLTFSKPTPMLSISSRSSWIHGLDSNNA